MSGRSGRIALAVGAAVLALSLAGGDQAAADRISDIRNTKHNLSVSGSSNVRATSEDEICVFCHTPHGSQQTDPTPLWNRRQSDATYTPYTSASLDATGLGQPGGSSKLCLSCHDGTLAIGAVDVLDGSFTDRDPLTPDISMNGTGSGGTMPPGAGANTGFTRNLGTDLTNDHPISFAYSDAVATLDGELRPPSSVPHIGNRVPGQDPVVPLEDGDLQCTSCHDPHIRDPLDENIKFLRLNRLQKSDPIAGTFDRKNDIVCLACHEKSGWAGSSHANSFVANETYTAQSSTLYEFPANIQVWQAACLNCHDTHSVQGSRRLLREGTDSVSVPKAGGNSAIEETCYLCHSSDGNTLLGQGSTGFPVPDIRTEFLRLRHMPISLQPEVHDIGTGGAAGAGADFLETRTLLGKGAPQNRHVECTDCHNPHRVVKKRLFNDVATVPDPAGTHRHESGSLHTNIASGVLKGTWGVEPVYGTSAFLANPTGYEVKRGNSEIGASTAVSNPYVTREYQICLKCHSDYGYDVPPQLGESPGTTTTGTNALTRYTNQAMEFQAPTSDRGETGGNHRSWHPVINSTGRSTAVRQANANNWLAPWNSSSFIGQQTMYCSDCHGAETANGTVVPPGGENGTPWGPHGSNQDFILKGQWNSQTGGGGTQNHLCFKCHDYADYAQRDGGASGFGGEKDDNLHGFHADKIGRLRCSWCHVAVPHGWKNKALLVNLNDVGPEAGLAPGTQVRNRTTAAYTQEPYYLNAYLKVRTFATSGNWQANNCGSAGSPGNGQVGRDWMRDSNENCENPP